MIASRRSCKVLAADARCGGQRRWEFIRANELTLVTSDHSPSPWSEKERDDFFAIWGGVSCCQSTLPVLLDGQRERNIELHPIVASVSERVAARFALPQKGATACGMDADLALVDLNESWTLTEDELCYRHKHSPFCGQPMRGRVRHVLLRGQRVVADGSPVSGIRGQLLTPACR
jgi:allantoinase